LEINASTGEPFLRLNQHKNIILTPHRLSDVVCYPPILNDPRVYEWLLCPPIPYLPEHAKTWFAFAQRYSKTVLSKLDAARAAPELIIVNACPVRAIREVKENGEEIYLGDIGIDRCMDGKLLALSAGAQADDEQAARYKEENCGRRAGDPDIIWYFGDYLKPSHHGQGIMTDAVETLLWRWAVPRMGVRRVLVSVFGGNHGSTRVFQKNGFVVTNTLKNYAKVRGKMRDFVVLEWDFGTVDKQVYS